MRHFTSNRALAWRLGLIFILVTVLLGCSSTPRKSEDEIPPKRTFEEVVPSDETFVIDQYDPLEGFNRSVYRFNAWFDRAIFLPLVSAYEFVLPDFVRTGVHNFMRNVGDIENLINSILQLKGTASLETASRLVFNTTFGLAGVWDPATHMGLTRHDEDFGQTLGHYGVGPGPYLVLPILGPSSVRDGVGLVADAYMFNEIDPLQFDDNDDAWEYSYIALNALDTRANLGFRYYETGSPFEYELMRLLYLKGRELRIAR